MTRVKFSAPKVLLAVVSLFALGTACTKSGNDSPNTLHIQVEAKIKGMDPVQADDIYSGQQASFAYEGLLAYSYLKRPYALEPNLAEAMPELSADKLTYTIHLRKGVLFQDDPCFKDTQGKGRELTADDFVYSWKRLADTKTTAAGWWIFDGAIVGLNAWREEGAKAGAADYAKPVEGLKATDRYTLRVTLLKPSAQFLLHLAQQFSFVVPKEAVEFYGKEFQNHAVGTGPFRLQDFNGASRITWVRNPTFRKKLYPSEGAAGDKEAGLLEDAGKPIPFLDKIVVQVFEEQQPMWLNFLAGKVDYAKVPKDSFDSAVTGPNKEISPELKAKGLRLEKTPEAEVTRITFNMEDPILGKNKLLRQAIALADDAPKSIELFYNGRAIQAQSTIPPGIAGFDENYKNPYRQFNLVKAKELLAKAGYPEGKGLPAFDYATLSDSVSRQWSEFHTKEFEALGLKLKINTYSWPEYQASIKNKRGQIYAGGAWIADYPDAENFLQLYITKNAPPGPNDGSYSNPEFDKMYEKSLAMNDSPERTALYKQMARVLDEDMPAIVGAHRVQYDFIQPWVRNFKRNVFELAFPMYLKIDPQAKR